MNEKDATAPSSAVAVPQANEPLRLAIHDGPGLVDLEIEAEPTGRVDDLARLVVNEGRLATQDAGGAPIRYVLASEREKRFLDPERTLADEGLRSGDRLEIVTRMVGGRGETPARDGGDPVGVAKQARMFTGRALSATAMLLAAVFWVDEVARTYARIQGGTKMSAKMRGRIATLLLSVVAVMVMTVGTTAPADAATAGRCPIAKWNTLAGLDGGCTCHVATRIGVPIPWSGDAGAWWHNAKGIWPEDENRPKVGAIAAFSYGHVSYVEALTLMSRTQTSPGTERVITSYRASWSWRRFRWETVPVYQTLATTQVTETYTVIASNRDYYRPQRGVYTTSWTAVRTYTLRNGAMVGERWSTPKSRGASGLLGYIYKP